MALKDLYNRYYVDYISANIAEATNPDTYNRPEVMKLMGGYEAAFNHDYQLHSVKIRLAHSLTDMLLRTRQQSLILSYLDNFNLYLNIRGCIAQAAAITGLAKAIECGTATNVSDAVARCAEHITNMDCHMYIVLNSLIHSPFQRAL